MLWMYSCRRLRKRAGAAVVKERIRVIVSGGASDLETVEVRRSLAMKEKVGQREVAVVRRWQQR